MFVRVEIDKRKQFVKIEDENITIKELVQKAVDSFHLHDVKGCVVKLFDKMDTIIDCDEILQYILQSNVRDEIVKIVFEQKSQNPVITSDDIEMYVDKNGGKDILASYKKNNSIDETMRRKLINIIVDFIIEQFGLYPSKEQKIAVAVATVNYFQCFKVATSSNDGIELFYNPVGGTGWIVSRLKTVRKNSKSDEEAETNQTNNIDDNGNNVIQINDPETDLESLRSIIPSADNIDHVHAMLINTIDRRKNMFEDKNLNLLVHFPYFFHCPELILFDFDQRFKNDKPADFLNLWPAYGNTVEKVLESHNAHLDFNTIFEGDIDKLLMLLKLLPVRHGGRANVSNRANFSKAIEKLVVFAKHGSPPINAIQEENHQPYIVLFGATPRIISKYFIVCEGNLIEVPRSYSFIETFDLLFKLHHVLNFAFEDNLKTMMNFIQHYMYKMVRANVKMTTHMIRVANDFERFRRT